MQGALGRMARAIGLVLIVLAVGLTGHWYVAWLKQYLTWNPPQYWLPRGLATYLFAILSAPAIPIAITIEWFLHGWPGELTWGSLSWVLGYGLFIGGRTRRGNSEDYFGPEHE